MANPNVDGSVTIGVDLDDKEAMKELNRLKREIKSLEKSIEDMRIKRSPLAEEMNEYAVQLDKAKAKLAELKYLQKQDEAVLSGGGIGQYDEYMRAYERQGEIAADIDRQEAEVKRLEKAWKDVSEKVREYDTRIGYAEEKLEKSKVAAGEMAKRVSTSEKAGRKMAEAQKKVNERLSGTSKGLGNIMKRLKGIAMSAVLFSVAYRALNSLTQYLGNMITANEEFADSLAAIKGNLLTAFQPIYEAVAPALGTLLDLVNSVTRGIAQFVSIIFGKSVKSSAEAAKNQYEMAGAIESTGDAAEKAQKQLLSFDELNILQDTSVDTGGVSDAADEIKASFELIGDAENESWVDKLTNSGFFKGLQLFWEDMKRLLTPAFEAIWTGATNALGWLLDVLQKADPETVKKVLEAIVAGIVAWKTAKTVAKIIDSVKNALSGFATMFANHPVLMSAGLIAAAAAAIVGIAEALNAYGKYKFNQTETGKFLQEVEKIKDNCDEAQESAHNLLEEIKVSESDAEKEYAGVTAIADKYFDLSQKATLTEGEKTLLEAYYNQLNDYAPGMLTNIDEVTKAWKGTSDELSNILKTQKDVYLEQMRAEYVMKLEFEIESAKIDQQMADDALAETKERIQSALDLSSSKELRKLGAQLKSMGDVGVDTYIDLAQALNRIDDDDVRIKNEIYSIVELIKGLDAMASESEETSDAIDKLTQKHEYYEKLLQGYSAETLIDEASEEKAEESGKKAGKNIILSMVEGMMSEEKVITDYVGNLADELEKQTESKVLLSDLQRIASVAKKKFGVDLKIPALATGSVIPPNRQFLAVLGDNKQEPEVVAPLSTIRQAVTEALSARGYGGSTPMTVVLELDGKEFGRAVFPSIQRESSRIGMKFVTK